MAVNAKRKKQPQRVRQNLLDSASRLVAEHGLSALTIQAVAAEAGVTKGGLLYHFGHKDDLVEAVLDDFLQHLGAEIDKMMAADPDPYGRFTRAYIKATFDGAVEEASASRGRMALSVSLFANRHLRGLWRSWLDDNLLRHGEGQTAGALILARLSADGIWLASALASDDAKPANLTAVQPYLIAMTRDPSRPPRNSPLEGRRS